MWTTTAGRYAAIPAAIAFAVLLGAPASAGVRPGVEIGANVSSFRYDDLDVFPQVTSHWDPGWRASVTGGASLEIPLRRRLSLMTGLRYVQQGNRVEVDIPDPPPQTGEFRIAQHYLAMPLLLAFRPLPSQRWFVAAGPEAALLLHGRSATEWSSPFGTSDSENITNSLQRGNLSLDAQAGLEFPAGRHLGIVILRYTHGLIETQRKADWGVAWKTRGVEALVGMRWQPAPPERTASRLTR